jgi:hypothetical protein
MRAKKGISNRFMIVFRAPLSKKTTDWADRPMNKRQLISPLLGATTAQLQPQNLYLIELIRPNVFFLKISDSLDV